MALGEADQPVSRPLSEKAPVSNAGAVCMLTSADVPLADRVRLHTVLSGRRRLVMIRASEAQKRRPALSRCSVCASEHVLWRAGYMMIDGVLSS